jgi:hypothetical protein
MSGTARRSEATRVIVGAAATPETLTDLLLAAFMLPESQLIR